MISAARSSGAQGCIGCALNFFGREFAVVIQICRTENVLGGIRQFHAAQTAVLVRIQLISMTINEAGERSPITDVARSVDLGRRDDAIHVGIIFRGSDFHVSKSLGQGDDAILIAIELGAVHLHPRLALTALLSTTTGLRRHGLIGGFGPHRLSAATRSHASRTTCSGLCTRCHAATCCRPTT